MLGCLPFISCLSSPINICTCLFPFATPSGHLSTWFDTPCLLVIIPSSPPPPFPVSPKPPPLFHEQYSTTLTNPPITRLTNLINAIFSIRPARHTGRVLSLHALQRRHAPITDPRRQRARIAAGVGLAAREGDFGVAEDGEVLVAVDEAGGEEASKCQASAQKH